MNAERASFSAQRAVLKLSYVCLSLIAVVSPVSGHSLALLTALALFLCCFASPLWNVLTELSNAEGEAKISVSSIRLSMSNVRLHFENKASNK